MVSVAQTGASWIRWGRQQPAPTRRGMVLAFTPAASRALADIPARVIDIGPRFRSGDYLVTLEFDRPHQYHNEVIQRIDAFRSELYPVKAQR